MPVTSRLPAMYVEIRLAMPPDRPLSACAAETGSVVPRSRAFSAVARPVISMCCPTRCRGRVTGYASSDGEAVDQGQVVTDRVDVELRGPARRSEIAALEVGHVVIEINQ